MWEKVKREGGEGGRQCWCCQKSRRLINNNNKKAHENTSPFLKPGNSQYVQNSFNFLQYWLQEKQSLKIQTQKSQKHKTR